MTFDDFSKLGRTFYLILVLFFSLNPSQIFSDQENDELEKSLEILQRYKCLVNDQKKFIWFRVPKVAQSTISHVFQKNECFVEFVDYNQYTLNLEEYKNYFKFTFVRNPWERVVSCYKNKVVNKDKGMADYFGNCFDKGFDYFVDFIDRQDSSIINPHICPQVLLIPPKNLDFIGRFENFSKDFQYVLNILDLHNIDIPKINATKHKHYSHYYNERTKAIIARKFKDDIDAFGYVFENKAK